ncbi:uncharacterized protein LOC125859208 [Solanum stenotomum]|uniref:uncharacterized protein LOC125859208 n=1 Tax=Solanum stenotomum TaxID=172797 RepID=UPI0020D0115A|nr:uncharacterized protein LOC125859208 [Solanum stenotomum]
MEGLNDMLKIVQEKLSLRGFRVSSRVGAELEITHLQYADDTLVFCDANKNQLKILRVIFVIFEAISGLHINWNKSFLYPVKSLIYPLWLGFWVEGLPTTYLGMPLGAKCKSISIWNGVIEKCGKRLDALRRNFRWEGNSETKKLHLVKWDTLIESKQARGLG